MKTIALLILNLVASAAFADEIKLNLTLGISTPADVAKKIGPAKGQPDKEPSETKHASGFKVTYSHGFLLSLTAFRKFEKSDVEKLVAANSIYKFGPPVTESYNAAIGDEKRTRVRYVSEDGTQVILYTFADSTKIIGYLYAGPIER